jgi:hypothetical protein
VSQQESMLVVSADAADFGGRAGGAVALAASRGTQLKRNAGPNLGLPQATLGEAYMRVFPQVTDRLS